MRAENNEQRHSNHIKDQQIATLDRGSQVRPHLTATFNGQLRLKTENNSWKVLSSNLSDQKQICPSNKMNLFDFEECIELLL